MNQETGQVIEISLIDIVSSLKNHIVLIILITALFAGSFFAFNKFVVVPTYDSTVKFYIEVLEVDQYNSMYGLQAVTLAQRIANTYVQLLQTNSFYHLILDELGTELPDSALRAMISYRSIQETEILQASVRTTQPDVSLKIAQAIANVAPKAMNDIKSNAILKVIDEPLLPGGPSTPNIRHNTALGFMLGLFCGCALAILVDMLNTKIKTEDDITRKFNVNVLGVVPKL